MRAGWDEKQQFYLAMALGEMGLLHALIREWDCILGCMDHDTHHGGNKSDWCEA